MTAWCVGCGAERPDALPGSPLTSRSCPNCKGPYAVQFGDTAPAAAANHALRAQDVAALLPKELA